MTDNQELTACIGYDFGTNDDESCVMITKGLNLEAAFHGKEAEAFLNLCKQFQEQLTATQQALAIRSKQIGVACLKHDLTHSLECGHCYGNMETQLQTTQQKLDVAVEALEDAKSVLADYAGKGSKSDVIYSKTNGVIPAGHASRCFLRIEAALNTIGGSNDK